jgi:hypothetical protein
MNQLCTKTIVSVILCFIITASTILAYFVLSATAYGWPQKDFFSEIPAQAKATITAVTFLMFHIPVFVSCIFYFILLCSVKRSSKVDTTEGIQDEILSRQVKMNGSVLSKRPGNTLLLSDHTKLYKK